MPLTRYQIRDEYSLADQELYKAVDRDDPEALLEGVALAGLVGVLRQLGDLAEFAAEIFHDLHEEVLATAARGHGLMVRVQQLEAEVPLIEKAFLSQTNHTPFYSNAGVDWHPILRTEQNLITRGDLPRCVMDSYEECRSPPRLFLLDKFDGAGAGACLKRYTDPSFFKAETAPSEVPRERKFRKVKKKGSRWKNGETPELVPTSHAKLHQLFLEESVEKGRSDPARLVKLKKRQLNASSFDSRSGKSYMEKFAETPPESNEVREISVTPLPLKLTSDNSSESGLEIYDITTVSLVKATSRGKEITHSSPNAHEVVLKPSMDELYGEVIDRHIVKGPEPSADGEREEVPSIHHKVMDEKEIAVDGEGKPEGSVDGDNSDDLTSEVDNYMDALTTMESEIEADHEYRLKSDIGFSNVETRGTDPDRNGEHLEFETHSSDFQLIENFSTSDDGSSSFKKERSTFSYSDTLSNLAEITPSDGEGSAIVFPTSEDFIPQNPEMPSNQFPAEVAVQRTKSHDLMLPNDMCIDENNICNLGEVSSNSSLVDSNDPLPSLDPATNSLQHQSGETPSESMKPCFTLSSRDGRETNLADSSAVFSEMHSQTSDGTPLAVSSESHSVGSLDDGDSHVSSYVSLHLSNNSELPPEKKSSDDSPDGCRDNAVDIKIGSPQTNTSRKEEEVPYSVLSEIEGSDVEKHDDFVSEVVDALPETEVDQGNSTSIRDASQNCSFKEQHLSDIVDDIPHVELESAEETALSSEEANIADTYGIEDSKKRGASTCKVDAVDPEAVPLELPFNYTDCSVLEDRGYLDDAVAESVQAVQELISQSNDTVNFGTQDPRKDGLECNELVSPECLTGPAAENETTQTEVSPKDVDSAPCKLTVRDESNSEMVDGVLNSLADVTQNGLPAGDVTIPPTASGLSDQELDLKSLCQSLLLDSGEDVVSSPAVHLPDPETSSEQPLELQADQIDVECVKAEAISNSPNHLSDQIQCSNNNTYQERLCNDVSESCQEDLSSEPSLSGYLQQSTGQEINITKQEMDSLSSVLPSFGLPTAAAQCNLEEMPPLPPLPPMQWRLGKIQHSPLVPQREFMDHSLGLFPSILPFGDHEKAQSAFPAQESDILQPANTFLSVSSVEVEKLQHVYEQVDNVMQPFWSSSQLPFMASDANRQTTSHGSGETQSLNPFLTLSALQDKKPEHGVHASEHEVVQSSSNPFLSLPAVEDTASKYGPVSSSEKLIHYLNQSASETGIQHASEKLEGEHGNPSDTSVLPPRKIEDTASKYDLVSSQENLIQPLNQSALEPGLQHTSENLEEGEHGNPSDTSVLSPRKLEDTTCSYDHVSSLEKSIHSLNQSASEPGLPTTSENSEEERRHPSDMSILPPRKVEEQPQHGFPISEGEPAWPSNPFALLATSEDGQVNGSSIVKIPRPRNPLIDSVAALDKSKLRKVTERVWPQSEPKAVERNSLLEQIRTKSFNLKPAAVSRPSVQGPKTNLRVAAILEKANAIRQATAGSDEDDDEDWSDS